MIKNVGSTDRMVRIVLGLVIIAAGIYFGSLLGVLGLILLATAAMGTCPVYMPFRFSTRKSK
jgi:hypothetical protein